MFAWTVDANLRSSLFMRPTVLLHFQRTPAVLIFFLSSRLNHGMNRWGWLFIVQEITTTAFQRASQIGKNTLKGQRAPGTLYSAVEEEKPRLICPVSLTNGCGKRLQMHLTIKNGKMLILAWEEKLKWKLIVWKQGSLCSLDRFYFVVFDLL